MNYVDQILSLASTIDLPFGAHKYLPYAKRRRDFLIGMKIGLGVIMLTMVTLLGLVILQKNEHLFTLLWVLGIETVLYIAIAFWHGLVTDSIHTEMEKYMRNYNSILEEMNLPQEFGRLESPEQAQHILEFLQSLARQVEQLQQTRKQEAAMPLLEKIRNVHGNGQAIKLIDPDQGWDIHFKRS